MGKSLGIKINEQYGPWKVIGKARKGCICVCPCGTEQVLDGNILVTKK